MARKVGLHPTISLARKVTAADTLNTDAALPVTQHADTGGPIQARGFTTVWLGLECDGGASPTATVSPRVRDESAPDGSRWKDLQVSGSPQSVALSNNGMLKEIRVDGQFFMPVVTAVTGAATSYSILILPGMPRQKAIP